MRSTILLILAAFILAGCSSTQERIDPNYKESLVVYERNQARAFELASRPCFELKAKPGETLTISGMESLSVSCGGNNAPAQAIPRPVQKQNPYVQAIKVLTPYAGLVTNFFTSKVSVESTERTIVGVANTIAGMDTSSSTSFIVSGNYGDTDNSVNTTSNTSSVLTVGGNLGDTSSEDVTYGDGYVIGDNNGDGDRSGDGTTINSGRIDSDDVDNSNSGRQDSDDINYLPCDPADEGCGE